MAERQGFEPWMAIHHTPFPGVRLKPLGHRSKVFIKCISNLKNKNYIIFKNFILLLIQHRHIRQQNNWYCLTTMILSIISMIKYLTKTLINVLQKFYIIYPILIMHNLCEVLNPATFAISFINNLLHKFFTI